MKIKLAVLSTLLVLLLAALLCSTAMAAAAKHKALRYRIIKHARAYDVVRRHDRTLIVRDGARYVKARDAKRYKVVARQRRFIILRRVSTTPARVPGNTSISSGTALPVNLPATASSSQWGNAPALGNDGKSTTHWSASSKKYPQWWMVDLGSATTVTGVRTDWYQGSKRAYRYRVETSLDGVTFVTAADRSKNRTRGVTTDAMNATARYVRLQVLGSSVGSARASVNEVTIYAAVAPTPDPSPSPTPSATPTATPSATPTPTPEPTAIPPTPTPTPTFSPSPTPTPTPTQTPRPTGPRIASLSTAHASIGAQLTVSGTGFGTVRGSSRVTFGESQVTTPSPTGGTRWSPCTKEATSYVSWSDTRIVVTVPRMSPGVAGYPGTYHRVRVYVGDVESNAVDFYIDPDVVNPSSSADLAWGGAKYRWNNAVTRTANGDTTAGVRGFDYVAPNNAFYGIHVKGSNLLFQNCTFTCMNPDIDGDWAGVVTVGQEHEAHNVTFVNCTFKGNWSTNNAGCFWHGVNGVKLVSYAHDITISDCLFEPHSRMSFEAIDWADPSVVENVAIRNCTFEPAGNQSISFGTGGDVYSLVENCLIKGYGNHARMYPHGSACWEANRTRYIVTRDCEIWAGVWGPFNMNGQSSNTPCHLYFEGVRAYFDSEHDYQSRHDTNGSAAMLEANAISYSRWKDCTFITGDVKKQVNNFAVTSWGAGPVSWGLDCNHNDFTGSTISGYVSWNGLQRPTTVTGYFRGSNAYPVLAGNILPRRL